MTANASTICAVGDLHGDLDHALQALRLCGVVDAVGKWSGGAATVVQTGDVVDRGNASLPLLHLLWSLRDQAAAAGGELLMLMGNHELLNMQGATHYVDPEEMSHFGGEAAWRRAMHPQHGEVGQRLSAQPGLAVRGVGACRTLFLHAGLRLQVGAAFGSIEAVNVALSAQVRANRGALLDARSGPLWWRGFARPHAAGLEEDEACAEVRAAVASVGDGAHRMTVGHNIVPFIATRCGGALHMIDVGMSSAYGGRPAAWRCSTDAVTGDAHVHALYIGGEETPPDLCHACGEAHRAHTAHALRGGDPHGDCRNYCLPGRRGASRRLRSAADGGDSPAGTWAGRMLAALGVEPSATDQPATVEQQQPQPSASNHVKTEF